MIDRPRSPDQRRRLELACDVVGAYVSHNALAAGDLPRLVTAVYGAMMAIGDAPEDAPEAGGEPRQPAVSIRKSVTPEFLICLDDGLKFKSLKRHLALLGMTPEQYREKWGLPPDYPMVAPNYAAARSRLAKNFGFGSPEAAPTRAGRNNGKTNG